MPYSYRKAHRRQRSGFFYELWDSFWERPTIKCPKCGNSITEYYDPFFFSPIRTIRGTRRLRCTGCKFVWRPNRKKRSLWVDW